MEIIGGDPILKLNQGHIRGKINTSETGGKFYSFCGIPYAKPPVGKLRFKYPQETKWNGVLDCTKERSEATQFELFTKEVVVSGEEDCLFVNLHLPNLGNNNDVELLPIMVHIHGGGFVSGSGNVKHFGPDYLLEKRIVYVSINYRLGVMGFLCTDPVNARGDMGLQDQHLALKWIKNNAKNFGGDPDNITIFGISAGSASVEYHILAEQSKGLFHKVIGHSGSAFCPWASVKNPIIYAKRLAKLLGRTTDDDEGLFDFINKFKAQELVAASTKILDFEDLKMGLYMAFVPAINVFNDGKGFINKDLVDIVKNGNFNKVPTMMGFDEKEGILMNFVYDDPVVKKDLLDNNYLKYIPNKLNTMFAGGNERLKKIYRPKLEDRNPRDHVIDFMTDICIVSGMFYSLDRRLDYIQDRQFYFMFSYEGELNLYHNTNENPEKLYGAAHMDEIGYLATAFKITKQPTPKDVAMRELMVTMWTNFIKFSDPTPDSFGINWKPVTKDKFQYMSLGTTVEMRNELIPERKKVWHEIYSNL